MKASKNSSAILSKELNNHTEKTLENKIWSSFSYGIICEEEDEHFSLAHLIILLEQNMYLARTLQLAAFAALLQITAARPLSPQEVAVSRPVNKSLNFPTHLIERGFADHILTYNRLMNTMTVSVIVRV